VDVQLVLLIIVVVTALALDFTNGFHDTGNAMATSIASGALKPKVAVVLQPDCRHRLHPPPGTRAADAPDAVINRAVDHVDGRQVVVGGGRRRDDATRLALGAGLLVRLRPGER
jgi:hypothetical protein